MRQGMYLALVSSYRPGWKEMHLSLEGPRPTGRCRGGCLPDSGWGKNSTVINPLKGMRRAGGTALQPRSSLKRQDVCITVFEDSEAEESMIPVGLGTFQANFTLPGSNWMKNW